MLTASMTELLIAALAFSGGHFLLSSKAVRPRLVRLLGVSRYLALYSALMIAALIWLVASYATAPDLPVWTPTMWSKHLSLTLMIPALILLAASLRRDNPTSVIGDPAKTNPQNLGIYAITRHPMMWGIGLWAVLHLLANGDLADMILFGSVGILALGGTIAIDGKQRRRNPEGFAHMAAMTSNLPFKAMLQGRAKLRGGKWPTAVIGGLALYAVSV